jgi:hypothetical protein
VQEALAQTCEGMMALELALQMYDELDALYEASYRDVVFGATAKTGGPSPQHHHTGMQPHSGSRGWLTRRTGTQPWLSAFGGTQAGDDVANVLDGSRKVRRACRAPSPRDCCCCCCCCCCY